jgi:hypothetical protein
MGVPTGAATLEIQLIADVARLQSDMSAMKRTIADATGSASASFQRTGAASAASAAQMAAAAQAAARAAMGNTAAVAGMGRASGLAAHHVTNLSFQINDMVTGVLSGQNPLRIMAQQSGQVVQIMQQAGLGVRGFTMALLEMIGIVKITTSATTAAALAQAAAQEAALTKMKEATVAAIARRQTSIALVQAELAGAASANAQAAAEGRLVTQLRLLEGETAKATVAQQALAASQAETAAAAQAHGATTALSLGRMATPLGLLAVGVGGLVAGFKLFQSTLEDRAPADQFIATLGLTDKEIKKLKNTTVSAGDIFKGLWTVIAERTGVDESIADFRSFMIQSFVDAVKAAGRAIAILYGETVGTYRGISKVWDNLPAMFGAVFARGVNAAAEKLERFINGTIEAINRMTAGINAIVGKELFGSIGKVTLGRVEADFSQSFGNIRGIIQGEIRAATAEAQSAIGGFIDDVGRAAIASRNERLRAQADDIIGDKADKAAKKTKKAKEEVDKLKKALEELMMVGLKADDLKTESLISGSIGNLDEILTPVADFGDRLLETLRLIGEQSALTGQALTSAFGPVGNVFATMIGNLAGYAEAEERLRQDVLERTKTQEQADKALSILRQRNTLSTIGALKGLFKEHSTGYKVMQGIERAYAIFQAAQTVAAIARDIGLTTSSVANATTRAAADQAAGAAKIFSQLGAFAFPVVAAMVAVLAAFGLAGRGGGGGGSAPATPGDLQAAAGTGTVLGDPAAKSASIANSLEILAKNSTKGNDYSAAMVSSLRKIESGIGNLAAALARAIGLKGGFFDSSTMGLGTNSSGGLFGIGGLFSSSTTKSLFDQGIILNPATVGAILDAGITGATYNVIETIKKKSGFLGIGGSTKTSYDEILGPLDPALTGQIQLIIGSIYDAVVDAAAVFGLDVAETLKNFSVQIGKLSFEGMTGEEITDQLEAIFSAVADQMAGFAVSGLEQYQRAGEGLFETLMRLAKEYLTIDAALRSIGMTFGSVGAASIAMRTSLIELSGGLEAFVDQVNFFYDNFLSDTQKLAFQQAEVEAAFAAMGVAVPATVEEFAALVTGLNLSTDAGQELFVALMAIAPAFYDIATAAEQLAQKQAELTVQLLQATGATEEALALQREIALAAMDPALHDLQLAVWAAQDAAKAEAAALALSNKEKQMTIELLRAQGNAEAALALERELALAALDPALHALQLQIWAAEDAARAAAEAERQKAEAERAVADAKDVLLQAYRRERDELAETAARFRGFAEDLRDFRASIFSPTSDAAGYRQALIKMLEQSGLARGGDERALGGGLQDATSQFLEASRLNARTIQDVRRAQALAARSVDEGIAGALAKASLAEQQLAALETQVGKLVDINESVITVAQAIERLTALMFPPSIPPPATNRHRLPRGSRGSLDPADIPEEFASDPRVIGLLERMNVAVEQGAIAQNRTSRVLERVTKNGDSIVISTDDDTPIGTVVV